jgi:hypothetical protein
MNANGMLFLGLLWKLNSGFPARSKLVAGIKIEGGFDTDFFGLFLIFDLSNGIAKTALNVETTRVSTLYLNLN